MKTIKTIIGSLVAVCTLMLCGCGNPVSSKIDDAYMSYQNGKASKTTAIMTELVQQCGDNTSAYDMANIGLSAMYFGIGCRDWNLCNEGIKLASKAWEKNPEECNKMFEKEGYVNGDCDTYTELFNHYYAEIQSAQLAAEIVGSWQTSYIDTFYNENQEINETLTLSADGTFTENIILGVNAVDGDYKIRAQLDVSVGGYWTIEGNVMSLRYDASGLTLDYVPGTFKLDLSSQGVWGDMIGAAFRGAMMEDQVKSELKHNAINSFTMKYQNSEPSYEISLENGDLIMRTYTDTLTYKRLSEE